MKNPLLCLATLVAALLSMCAGAAVVAAALSLWLRSPRCSVDSAVLAVALGSGALICGVLVALRALGLVE